jgi:hypothetical protein
LILLVACPHLFVRLLSTSCSQKRDINNFERLARHWKRDGMKIIRINLNIIVFYLQAIWVASTIRGTYNVVFSRELRLLVKIRQGRH